MGASIIDKCEKYKELKKVNPNDTQFNEIKNFLKSPKVREFSKKMATLGNEKRLRLPGVLDSL